MKTTLAFAVALALTLSIAAQDAGLEKKVDAVFAKGSTSTPGCAVGVGVNGAPVVTKGYGMADLEHDVPITADTIFEGGSVSKQFTAAAVLLLARDGKLSLDEPARKYIPELTDYQRPGAPKPSGEGGPLLIRHMLNHTSGLRDWGAVSSIAGWPRTTRVHRHVHVLEIVSKQTKLNFEPGTQWSYSNTGFNLAAIIVERVSGMTFQEFTRQRLFQPLGMTHTSWRDDFTRIVKGRAIAYDRGTGGEFRMNMPFENIYGNGGLLTTVGDLLKWNENFTTHTVGDEAFAKEQQTPGTFSDGRSHDYGLGLWSNTYKGVREVYHSGTTAGYSAFLTRFPDQRVSVAVLCNFSTNATQFAHQVADIYLGDHVKATPPAFNMISTEAAGLYRSTLTGLAVTLTAGRDTRQANRVWATDGKGNAKVRDAFGGIERYERVPAAKPTPQDLAAYVGVYTSADAETELTAVVENGALVLKRRPDAVIKLTPTYADAFTATNGLGTVIFRRDASGKVTGLSVVQDRVWDMRFTRR